MTQPHPKPSAGEAESQKDSPTHSGGFHKWMMTLCLVLMGVAMLTVMWRGNAFGAGSWLLLLPMALCLGVHLLLHRHGHRHE
ncbi:hypothetical protein ACOJCM_03720 [Billgrantia sp. LNSP4103-1]|uniref:hypothetical protein n=1 Tax=Billgrantia sp. LNSP4103-1 TaxID=3410266 RepID=UPI00403F8E27